jgi:ligand-binding sensor domain-containing protein/signal transduction histidine kinase
MLSRHGRFIPGLARILPAPHSDRRLAFCLGLIQMAILLAAGAARADSKLGDFAITHWTRENGLPDNSVTCLMQTRDGFLWVGTVAGLVRFDGLRFFPLNLPVPASQTGNEITALYQDAKDRLWIGTRQHGLWCLAAGALSQVNPNRGFGASAVTSIAGDSHGDLWVGTATGLNRLGGTNVTLFTVADGLPSDFVSSVHFSMSGTVWITTRKGMCQFKNGRLTPFEFQTDSPRQSAEMIGMYDDQRGNLWAFGDSYLVNLNDGKRFNYFRNGDTTSLRIWSLCEGRDGQLWIGTSGQGVFSFADGRFRPLSLREASLSSDVQAICEDRDGSVWLGTFSGGLVRLQPRHVQVLNSGAGLPAEMATCLAPLADRELWVGFANGGLFSSAGDRFDKPRTPDGSACPNLISSMATTSKGELWLGTQGLGLIRLKDGTATRLTTENGLADDEILAVAAQKDDSIWAGTRAGTLHHITNLGIESFRHEPPDPITCILMGSSGTVWIGTENGGLARLTGGRLAGADPSGVLARTPIRALWEDADGRLWIGTQGRGLACRSEGQITVWDAKAGFPDNEVNGIVADDSGKLWFNTPKGVYRMSLPVGGKHHADSLPALQLVSEYDHSSSAVSKQGWPQAVKSRDGRLWFVGANGLCVVDPRDFQTSFQPWQVELGPVLVNGRPLRVANASADADPGAPGKPLRFPASLRTLEIEFTVPSLNWPERVEFQHRMDNFDSDWVEGGPERRVRYSGLPFGQYRFRVRAMNLDGTWGRENSSLVFDLPVPLWRSPLILAVEGLVALTAVAGVVRLISHRRLRLTLAQLGHQQAMERERMRIARDMHDEVGSKLTRISYLSELALQDEVPSRQNLRSIAQTTRDLLQTVDEIVWAVDPQNDTLENLAAYLGHYATEYLQNTSIECELNIAPDLPLHPLTAETRHNLFLAFEEAVGNALKHSGATRVRVAMTRANGNFEISIQDNGRGFDSPSGVAVAKGKTSTPNNKGNGLVNMRQRLSSIGGQALIESSPGQGTSVIFSLPVNEEPTNNA